MARLINADALVDKFWQEECRTQTRRNFVAMVNYAPTVDAVEVVRCKDCMWSRPKDNREPTDTPRELICQCFKHHHIPAPWGARMAVNTDDFCSYGERKDGDGNG